MKNKIINAYIYSYASLLVIIASYKIIALLLRKNYMDAFADLFINYQGGFIRRGLIGSLLLSIYQISGISPIALAIVLSIAAYSFIFLYCLSKLKPYNYGFAFLTPCYLLGGIGIYGLGYMRRDYIILSAFLLITFLWKRLSARLWLYISLFICIITILCYEPFLFVCLPYFAILNQLKCQKVRTTIIALFILLLTFTICCLYPGTPIAKKQIWESTRSFLPQIGTIEFIGRNSMEVMKFHFYNNFIRIEHNVPCLAISLVSVIGMTYYLTNGLYVFNKDKFQVNDRKGIMFYLCLSYIFQIPMFICLSTDYSRICTYSAFTTIIMFTTIKYDTLVRYIPNKIDKKLNSIIEFTDIVFKPTKFKIFSIMLIIGIAEWTGGGIGQFIYSSELGTIIKCIKTIINFHL